MYKELWCFNGVNPEQKIKKHSTGRMFEKPGLSCDVTIMAQSILTNILN